MALVVEGPMFSGFQWKMRKLAEADTAMALVAKGPMFSGF